MISSNEGQRKEIQLDAGTIRYREAGSGPPIVFVHGYLVDSRLWDGVVDSLSDRFRCIAPDWPMGSHQVPVSPGADLTPYGFAAIVADLLAKLELEEVTLVGNDSGGAQCQIVATRHRERIGRLVLTNCDTHENFPPGLFKLLPPLAKVPGAMSALAAPLRIGPLARAAFRPFTKQPLPPELVADWVRPSATDRRIRDDNRRLVLGMRKRYTIEAAERLRRDPLPLLLAWGTDDRWVFPIRHAERLAGEVAGADLVRIPDGRTFLPCDRPQRVAEQIARFAGTA
jgi:pimeloyl-ACP methyl ester carboxylesterase